MKSEIENALRKASSFFEWNFFLNFAYSKLIVSESFFLIFYKLFLAFSWIDSEKSEIELMLQKSSIFFEWNFENFFILQLLKINFFRIIFF